MSRGLNRTERAHGLAAILFWMPLIFIAFLFFMVMLSAGQSHALKHRQDFNLDVINAFREAKKQADISAIFIGNSRVRHAVPFGFDPSEIIILPNGQKLAALQFGVNGAIFQAYDDLLDAFIEADPDMIWLQNSLISNQRVSRAKPVTYSKIVYQYLSNQIWPRDPYEEWTHERHDILETCIKNFNDSHARERIDLMTRRDRHSFDTDKNSNYALSTEFIARALKSGIDIRILALNPNTEPLEKFGIESHFIDFHGIGYDPKPQDLLPEHHNQVRWMDYTPSKGAHHFCDFVHLNEAGRQDFERWVLPRFDL